MTVRRHRAPRAAPRAERQALRQRRGAACSPGSPSPASPACSRSFPTSTTTSTATMTPPQGARIMYATPTATASGSSAARSLPDVNLATIDTSPRIAGTNRIASIESFVASPTPGGRAVAAGTRTLSHDARGHPFDPGKAALPRRAGGQSKRSAFLRLQNRLLVTPAPARERYRNHGCRLGLQTEPFL